MARRLPSQVHNRVSRLLQGGHPALEAHPIWYQSVLKYPPLPLPSKAPVSRSQFDALPAIPSVAEGGSRPLRAKKVEPEPIYYLEDDIRRQFYRDHPYEAFRPKTLVETEKIEDPHPVQGKAWVRLRQRSRNPTVEDAIQFAVNLHHHHDVSVSSAYARAVSQFRALRAEQQCATLFGIMEAEEFGVVWGPTEIQLSFMKERRYLEGWESTERDDRWKNTSTKPTPAHGWSGGREYVRLWQENIRPDYAPQELG
ncbi:mitochondrial ribosomal protein S25 [Flagelloscypha sp. PMI_526]|nr:mitochondrial ribosomal protein S25 [Flagelloscypha sp. PMI_526]